MTPRARPSTTPGTTDLAGPQADAGALSAAQRQEIEALRRTLRLADAYAVSLIESEAHPVTIDGSRWLDVRPMTDDREHGPADIVLMHSALAHARDRGLLTRHRLLDHLVRVGARR